MEQIIDSIILILAVLFNLIFYQDFSMSVLTSFLIFVILISLLPSLRNPILRAIPGLTTIFISLFIIDFFFFLPVLFYQYSGIKRERTYCFALLLPFFIYTFVKPVSFPHFSLQLFLIIISLLLGIRSTRLREIRDQMNTLRDSTTELTMALREKNKSLMEKQDYEIHLATLSERNRIAREIHDHVGHMLSRSILQMGALQTIYKEEPLHSQLVEVNDTLNQAMNNIRESVHDLHDDSIDLQQAVLDATDVMRAKYDVIIDYDMSNLVTRNVKFCFIAIVKEAMSNIVKHSDATKINIILREHPSFYQLAIEDNGTVQKLEDTKRGIGLNNIEERVTNLDGTLHIHTDHGFKIFISIPKENCSQAPK